MQSAILRLILGYCLAVRAVSGAVRKSRYIGGRQADAKCQQWSTCHKIEMCENYMLSV